MNICPMCNNKIPVLYFTHLRNCTKEYIKKHGLNATIYKTQQLKNEYEQKGLLKRVKHKRIA